MTKTDGNPQIGIRLVDAHHWFTDRLPGIDPRQRPQLQSLAIASHVVSTNRRGAPARCHHVAATWGVGRIGASVEQAIFDSVRTLHGVPVLDGTKWIPGPPPRRSDEAVS